MAKKKRKRTTTEKREYFRLYRQKERERAREKAAKLYEKNNPPKSEVVEDNMDKGMKDDLMELAKDVFKDKGGKPDPALKYVERGMKYLPILGKFVQGFLSNMPVPQQQQQTNTIHPPPGWVGMAPLEKLKRKLDATGNITAWYKQGMMYDQSFSGINVDYVDPNYVPKRQSRIPVYEEQPQPKNLKELSNRYQDPPVIEDVKNSDKVDSSMNSETEKINEALLQDARKYLVMGIDYINKLSPQEFEIYLDDTESLYKKFSRFKLFFPIHLKEFMLNTPSDQIILLLQEQCPDKFKVISEKKKQAEIEKLFDKIKEDLSR